MNNKVGILTLPPISNYGGILQNYALQKVLKSNNYEPITLERRRGYKIDIINTIKNHSYRRLLGNYYYQLNNEMRKKAYSEQFRFKEQFIHSSPLLRSTAALKAYIMQNNIPSVIVGSDQVWRADYTYFLKDMFFCFLADQDKIKKIAYAASFGKDTIEFSKEQLYDIKNSIKSFDLVSVREDSGIRICEEKFGVKANHVLDPTMLLTKDDYKDDFSLDVQKSKKSGLYTYLLDGSEKKDEFAKRIISYHNWGAFQFQPKAFEGSKSKNLADYYCPSVEDWVNGFYMADFIITDSFHGTVFSIIFNKPFYALVNRKKGAARFESLLKMVGLEERLIDIELLDENEIQKLIQDIDINYKEVNCRLDFLRKDSLDLLLKGLLNRHFI